MATVTSHARILFAVAVQLRTIALRLWAGPIE